MTGKSNVETCRSRCCGQDITCTEPTRAMNRKIMYGLSSFQFLLSTLLLIIVGAASCPWNEVTGTIMNTLFIPELGNIAVGSFVLAFLLSALASLIALFAYRRGKSPLALLLVLQLVLSVLLVGIGGQAVFLSSGSEVLSDTASVYHTHWLRAVAEATSAVADGSGTPGALAFVHLVQDQGKCCQWLLSTEVSDIDENPISIGCDGSVNTAPCQEWVAENLGTLSGRLGGTVVGIGVVYVISVMSSFGVLCRIKEMYQSERMDFGDFIDSRNGIKHISDLTEA